MSELTRFLIVCPLVFLAGFVDAIAGGGGLISLPAYLISGLPAHTAIGTNKISSTMGTSLTTWKFWRQGYIELRLGAFCAVCAIAGSVCGANLALLVSDRILKNLLLVVLPLIAFYVFRSKDLENAGQDRLPAKKTLALAAVCSFGIGVYDGFYGPGTGTFLLLLLTGLARMELRKAAGTTKVINLSTNVAALAVYLINGTVYPVLGLVAGVFNIAGNWLGARSFSKNGVRIVKPVIGFVLALFFIRVLWDLLSK